MIRTVVILLIILLVAAGGYFAYEQFFKKDPCKEDVNDPLWELPAECLGRIRDDKIRVQNE